MTTRLSCGRPAAACAAALTLTSVFALGTASATEPLQITVHGTPVPPPATTVVSPSPLEYTPAADAGDYLRSLPGVTGGRMGGHATEITIRGQSQDRLAIISDGAYTFGGCPNRMDPPTSTVPLSLMDSVVVQRGYQSVVNGAPAPGGTVLMETKAPTFAAFGFSGGITAGIEDNGFMGFTALDAAMGSQEGFIRATGHAKKAENYEDGDGREVRSAFEQQGLGLTTGWRYAPQSLLQFSAERDEIEDALFAGAGMDAPVSNTDTYRLNLDHAVLDAGIVTRVEASVYGSLVDHLMDNYSLRPVTVPMKMATVTSSNTWGGRAAVTLDLSRAEVQVGVDHRTNERDGTTYAGMAAMAGDPRAAVAYLWPGMEIADTGVFAEADIPLAEATTLTAGARVDFVSADATKAGDVPSTGRPSAAAVYRTYYGAVDTSQEETNLSGLMRLTHDFGPFSGWAGVSRAVRTADATERGMARGGTWIGNPNIEPEKHHQVDTGIETGGSGWSGSLGGWVDSVQDFITRDTARGQAGVLMSDGATIYRNVDALIAGIEVSGAWAIVPGWTLTGNAVYTWGENTTDDRPLYQIPPLSGAVEVSWTDGDWGAGSRLRWALEQTRVDDDVTTGSGLDVRQTPGYGVFDLFATYTGFQGVEVRAGITNLFDEAYASHLSRSNGIDPQMVQVNEPGRSFYMQGKVTF